MFISHTYKVSKNWSAKYYAENKERLEKTACVRYQNLSEEEEEKQRQYGRECYKNLSEYERLLRIEENIKECEKVLDSNYLKNDNLESSFDEEYKNVLKL